MQGCRNCGAQDMKDLGFVGEVAPFFLKRVLNLELKTSQSRHPLRLLTRRMLVLPQRLFSKVFGCSAYVEMQICLSCSFIQTKHAFSEEAINRLYFDYRSTTYNAERIQYEPTYAALANDVGAGDQEIRARVDGLTTFLADKIDHDGDFSMLDFGGADGRFLPKIDGKKYVLEISNISPLEGVVRIQSEAELGTYSYVQVAHVFEHVPEPLALLRHISSFVKPSGYVYIEVPQELTDAQLEELKKASAPRGLTVHEHINSYCSSSVAHLVEAAGLNSMSIKAMQTDLGWVKSTIIRALCQKPA